MKQILEEKGILDKTIKSSGYGNNAFCLVFTDETFCIIRGCGYQEWDVEFSNEEISLIPTMLNSYNLASMGLITEEEAADVWRKERAESAKKGEEREYQQYLLLKDKFEKNEE